MANKENIQPGEFLLSNNSPFAIKEAYRALRSNILFSLPGKDSAVIGFTSDGRSEGKSTNAVNTALAFSEIGKTVVLMDCDLRLPTVARKLSLPNAPGLSDLLIGEAKTSEAMHTIRPNLYIIPAGRIPKDPTRLLVSSVLESFIEHLKTFADIIILDLPPVNTVTDAAIMSKFIDGFILVARRSVSDKRAISEELRLLEMANAKIIGFLYNDAAIDSKKDYKKDYYYGG